MTRFQAVGAMIETVLATVAVTGLRFLWRYYRHRADWWRDDTRSER